MAKTQTAKVTLVIHTATGKLQRTALSTPPMITLILPHEGQQIFYRHNDGEYRLLPEKNPKPAKPSVTAARPKKRST